MDWEAVSRGTPLSDYVAPRVCFEASARVCVSAHVRASIEWTLPTSITHDRALVCAQCESWKLAALALIGLHRF